MAPECISGNLYWACSKDANLCKTHWVTWMGTLCTTLSCTMLLYDNMGLGTIPTDHNPHRQKNVQLSAASSRADLSKFGGCLQTCTSKL